MSKCELTGKGPIVKNLVSHSNVKTKKWTKPNIQKRRLFSEALNSFVTLRIANSTVRTIDHVGGFDRFILRQPSDLLSKRALQVKGRVSKVVKG
ncbi:MAG: 50S ribosomal protein L28 [Myxococcales bacterium]|nr:50S ribosomal protein L28 [Myxococcales bacterium]